MSAYKFLTEEQVEHFLAHGYLRLSNAFTQEKVSKFTGDVWVRLGMDPNDQSTWDKERINMPHHRQELVQTFSPLAWGAMCELLGGEERVDPIHANWNDGLIVNLGKPEYVGQEPPHPRDLPGWHVDGDFFRHFLDSPEQGLLVIPLFAPIKPKGGGTMIAPDGIGHVARLLASHPEGLLPSEIPYKKLSDMCEEFVELTGDVGDVILMHPLMLHSASQNNLRIPRIITNPPVSLLSPFCFSRADPSQYSLVELKTIRAMGMTPEQGIPFEIAREREQVIPERLKVQSKMMEEEKARLEAVRQAATSRGMLETENSRTAVAV